MSAASALPPVYDWANHSATRPTTPLPGERLAEQFFQHAAAIRDLHARLADLVDAMGNIGPGKVIESSVESGFLGRITREIQHKADAVEARLTTLDSALHKAKVIAAAAVQAARDTGERILRIEDSARHADEVESRIQSALAMAMPVLNSTLATIDTYANDAEYYANLASDYATLAGAWAEHMPDTIPPNILAVMDITGDHWSARWWAHQAQNMVGVYPGLYLGPWPHAPAPGENNPNPYGPDCPSPIPAGAMYFDTNTSQSLIWSGSAWQTNTTTGGGMPEAPIDGSLYGRKDAGWTQSYSKLYLDATFAPLASPTFTGDPKAPTPATSDNDTSIATTQYVKAQGYLTDALSNGSTYGRRNGAWSAVPGAVSIADAPPPSPVDGQLWWESDQGKFWIYYIDPSGAPGQWVEASGPGGGPLYWSDIVDPPFPHWTVSTSAPSGGVDGDVWFQVP